MDKPFAEVFPNYKPERDTEGLLKNLIVYKVTSSKDKRLFTVHVRASYLISRREIRKIEKSLNSQLSQEGKIGFRICETFELSNAYTPGTIFDEYKPSLEETLREKSPVLESLFHRADINVEESGENGNSATVTVTFEDTGVSHSMEKELFSTLEEALRERCRMNVGFKALYVPPTHSKLFEDSRVRMKNELDILRKREEGESVSSPDEDYMEVKGENEELFDEADSKKLPPRLQKGKKGKAGKGAVKEGYRKSDDPNILYGRDFTDRTTYRGKEKVISMDIADIAGDMNEVVIRGKIVTTEATPLKNNERTILRLTVTDFTDTIYIKLFIDNSDQKEIEADIHKGVFIQVRGRAAYDDFDKQVCIGNVVGIRRISDFTVKRMDNSPRKRVELHCHTKMSDMDGVSEVTDIVKRAKEWGMKGIAITDHGVVQAFTDANHAIKPGDPFKIIYGMEGYLVDDEKVIVSDPAGQGYMDTFVVFDLETTGFSPVKERIIEIGAVKISGGTIVDSFQTFVNPGKPIPFNITELTGIGDSMVKDAPGIEEALPRFLDFCGSAVLVGHNVSFDMSFVRENAGKLGISVDNTVVDTLMLARHLLQDIAKYKLNNVAKRLKVDFDEEGHHRADYDAKGTALIFMKLCDMLSERGINDLDELAQVDIFTPEMIKKLPSYHVIILAKNDTGRVNLYRLVSESHLKYCKKNPRIPKSLLNSHREGLIVGSACEAGELFRAVLDGAPPEELARIVGFYDYLEIQPIGNNEFLVREERVKDDEELRDLNRKIVDLGEKWGKPVCATCDVHFLDPEDEVYRRILMAGKGFTDADNQAPLYLHTTDEMLQEFSYLGMEKAEEVVITNTNLIADMIDKISPVRPDKCPPVIEHSEEDLRDMCYEKAHEIYGEKLPETVEKRLEKELHSIISNGFAVMYIIAQKLVKKSNDDGYLVGSRGSVGSSFVAFLAGITEVNSLSPHYYCEKCHFSDFDSPEVKSFSGMGGCDMPDRVCPVCGEKLKKDGFDIPFETFLGFKGDKEPDIDLNFSGEYQANAHKYTEVIFGEGHTFKAGTVGTVADKTAFGYVKKYFQERGISKKSCEIERISMGCTGVKRTTGQHPGGIIVLPHGEEINFFTPVQNPANDDQSGIITTHFDYHSIDHNLLKLDILGHDDPTMIRFLQDVTGVDPKSVPLDDKEVMSLFESTKALGITPDDIGGCQLGALGIPEFGTDFAMQMLIDTKPKYFSDLVRIAGLSHGTDVYKGNAEDLIKSGTATISTAICTRDDIMVYLIDKGLDPSDAFKIMENVRKGKVAGGKVEQWPGWKEDMAAHGVPDWYIGSCEKIKYMFPKAHAAAYVMMAWRIAWFKINYPLAYYAAYFSIRADDNFSYELMAQGREDLDHNLELLRRKGDDMAPKEKEQIKVMRIVQEMYARGFDFEPINLQEVGASTFKIVGNKLMPSLACIDKVGKNAAEAIVAAAKNATFTSLDDFRNRSGVGQSICDIIYDLGLLGDIPKTDQMSIFDLM